MRTFIASALVAASCALKLRIADSQDQVLFDSIDADQDDLIQKTEAEAFFSAQGGLPPNFDERWAEIDANGDDVVDFAEF